MSHNTQFQRLASATAAACVLAVGPAHAVKRSGSASFPSQEMTADECAVFARERAFAASVAAHDKTAFSAFVHPGAVFGAGGPAPQRGKDAVIAAWRPIIDGVALTIDWRPAHVAIGGDPNHAFSQGPYVITDHDPAGAVRRRGGVFTSVWVRKNARSPWLVLFDGAGAAPQLFASEAEAAAYLAAAPARCDAARDM